MTLTKIPPSTSLVDKQFIQVTGPDGIISGFIYNRETHTLYAKESQVLSQGAHGITHISEDLIPSATCDTPGLLSADDKCKLDALMQTRVGVLGFQGAGFCVIPGCRVLTADGDHKPIELIQEGDIVVTHTGLPRVVEKVYQRDIDEDVFQIDCRGHRKGGLRVTGDHKVLAIKRSDVKCVKPECKARSGIPCRHRSRNCNGCAYDNLPRAVPQWIKAKDLSVGDFVTVRHASSATMEMQSIRVLDHIEGRVLNGRVYTEAKQLKVYGVEQDAGSMRICTTSKTNLPEYLSLSPDFLKLCGYYLAEGYSGKKRLGFAIHSDELVDGDIGGEIQRIVKSLFGIESTIVRNETLGIELVYHHATLARLLGSLFGHSAKLKRIPRFIMELPAFLQRNLVVGMFQGDGSSKNCYDSKNISIQLANQELVEQIACLIERCGGNPSLCKPSSRLDPWQLKAGNKVFRSSFALNVQADTVPWLWAGLGRDPYNKPNQFALDMVQGQHHLREIRGITIKRYSGVVHDFSVGDDHSYNVNGVVLHNSDDGGMLQGDIILAAGSGYISIERIGNVVRFLVDAPTQLNCSCEVCSQIYWVSDESEVSSIRPPSCGGRLPGISNYGELKVYLLPESTIVDPTNPTPTLNTKGNYPSFIFKRYDDSITPGLAEIDITLKRDKNNITESSVGWAMTPGAGATAECVWMMGEDSSGNRMRYELKPDTTANMLGTILYKGHLLTKQMAVITDYTAQVLGTNQYTCKFWDVAGGAAIGSSFTATNVWQYDNPEASSTGTGSKSLMLDKFTNLLPVGTLVELWYYQIGSVAGMAILRYYFSKRPADNPANNWVTAGAVQFGDTLVAKIENQTTGGGTDSTEVESVSSIRDFEPSEWGITNLDNPLILFADALTDGPDPTVSVELNDQHRAYVDSSLPGLRVDAAAGNTEPFSQRPVYLWCRKSMGNMLSTTYVGRPNVNGFPPYDVLLTAPIDNYDNVYARVVGKGSFINAAGYWVLLKGAHHKELPSFGSLRTLTAPRNEVWRFDNKMVYPSLDDDAIALSGPTEFPGEIGSVAELLHQEYSVPCVRVQFDTISATDDTVQLQFKVGTLDMSQLYEEDVSTDYSDDYVRGFTPGYAVSAVYSQTGLYTGVGAAPANEVDGFVVYEGGVVGSSTPDQEYWNELEIMQADGQVWIWWNGLLIPPNSVLSAALPTPVSISTPYFPVTLPAAFGKFGLRLFPGAKVRRAQVRSQSRGYSPYWRGQLEIS